MTGLSRPIELLLASAGLAATAPLVACAALAVKLTSPGPAFFRQERMGNDGRPFTLVKLRTMRATADGPAVTSSGDARITPIGRVLRKTKLDELPELFNVLMGDMSFVGPRPEVPAYVDLTDARWQRVLRARPGITDPVTLRLRNEEELLARVPTADRERFYKEDLLAWKLRGYADYLDRRSWWSDLGVMAKTVVAVVVPSIAPAPSPDEIRRDR